MASSGVNSGGASGIGGLLYSNPGYTGASLDDGTQSIINNQVDKANQSTGQLTQGDLNNVNTSGVDTGQNQRQQAAMGGNQDPAMQSALQGRANRLFGNNLNQLQRQTAAQAPVQQAQNESNAWGALSGAQNMNNAVNMAQLQASANNTNSRNSIISGIFGIAGTGAGLAAGSGGGS